MECGRALAENTNFMEMQTNTLNINDDIPIVCTTTNTDIQKLGSLIFHKIMEQLDPVLRQLKKVSEYDSSPVSEKLDLTQQKDSTVHDKDLIYQNEILKVRLDEAEKQITLLQNEVIDMTKLLEAKINTSSINPISPTKEYLFSSNTPLLSTSLSAPFLNTPSGNIVYNDKNNSNNNSILSTESTSFVPTINENLDTPIVYEKAKSKLHSSNKILQDTVNKNVEEITSIERILNELENDINDVSYNSNYSNNSSKNNNNGNKNSFIATSKGNLSFKSTTLVSRQENKYTKEEPVNSNRFISTHLITSKKEEVNSVLVTKESGNEPDSTLPIVILDNKTESQTNLSSKPISKSAKEEVGNNDTDENSKASKKHHWPKGTCVITGDSMLEGIDERRMSSKRLVKVRSFPGATIDDMKHYLIPILAKKPDHIILHVGTNDATNSEGRVIVDKLLQLKFFILEKLPLVNVIISKPIHRADAKKLTDVVSDVNSKLDELSIDMIENVNIVKDHLNAKGLHLNRKGILVFAKNLIDGIRKL